MWSLFNNSILRVAQLTFLLFSILVGAALLMAANSSPDDSKVCSELTRPKEGKDWVFHSISRSALCRYKPPLAPLSSSSSMRSSFKSSQASPWLLFSGGDCPWFALKYGLALWAFLCVWVWISIRSSNVPPLKNKQRKNLHYYYWRSKYTTK